MPSKGYIEAKANLVLDDGTVLGSVKVEILVKETEFDYTGRVDVYAQIARRPDGWDSENNKFKIGEKLMCPDCKEGEIGEDLECNNCSFYIG